jgi:cellulose synthase/poly-beta-1,6-N-acetylglucosamine synthase-like glycosyltransferase
MNSTIIISSFKEPNLKKAIEESLNQDTKLNYNLLIISPDKEAEDLVNFYKKKKKKIELLKDPGKGKSFGLNLSFKKLKSDIWVFTDGDVYLDKNAIQNIITAFNDKTLGCICGRIIPTNSKENRIGYWAHLLADAGAHAIRRKLSDKNKFFECSGYLFAFRKGLISKIPLDVAEDSFIPYVIFQKGYKIKYLSEAKVYVKNPDTLKDFINQRIRTAKAHTSLTRYFKNFPKVKSFKNEIKEGTFNALKYPSNFKEFLWTIELFFVRLYIWLRKFYDERIISQKNYSDGWEKIESTK